MNYQTLRNLFLAGMCLAGTACAGERKIRVDPDIKKLVELVKQNTTAEYSASGDKYILKLPLKEPWCEGEESKRFKYLSVEYHDEAQLDKIGPEDWLVIAPLRENKKEGTEICLEEELTIFDCGLDGAICEGPSKQCDYSKVHPYCFEIISSNQPDLSKALKKMSKEDKENKYKAMVKDITSQLEEIIKNKK